MNGAGLGHGIVLPFPSHTSVLLVECEQTLVRPVAVHEYQIADDQGRGRVLPGNDGAAEVSHQVPAPHFLARGRLEADHPQVRSQDKNAVAVHGRGGARAIVGGGEDAAIRVIGRAERGRPDLRAGVGVQGHAEFPIGAVHEAAQLSERLPAADRCKNVIRGLEVHLFGDCFERLGHPLASKSEAVLTQHLQQLVAPGLKVVFPVHL